MLVFACLMHTKRIISTGEGEDPVVTERNSPVTLRPFTVTGDPVYDEAAKSTETVFLTNCKREFSILCRVEMNRYIAK